MKKRLDVLLVERGLAVSRTQAQALVMAGLVPGYDKPGQQVDERRRAVDRPRPRVRLARRREARARARRARASIRRGSTCSTSARRQAGFTDVLLQRGASRVIAVDVGYGQLHPKLRDDPRVVVFERTNARALTELPFAPQLVVCDVSFISVRTALPPVLELAAPDWEAVVLVKPQFEAGRADVAKGSGVVRDPVIRARVLREIAYAALGWRARGGRGRRLRAPRAKGQPGVLPSPADTMTTQNFRMTSTSESTKPSPRVETAAVVTHGQVDVESGVERLRNVAKRSGVTLVDDARDADLAVVLGGDGTMLQDARPAARQRRAGDRRQLRPRRLPCVDSGRTDLERDLERVFAGEYVTVAAPDPQVRLDGERYIAVNDVVVTSSTLGKMIELAWAIGGEDLGVVPCDGMICSTPSGSTAYNLSNGGPVLVRGLDAMAVTFIAPHSLHARPFVVPARGGGDGRECDGRRRRGASRRRPARCGGGPGDEVGIYLAEERSLLATLPETTFFSRYRETFSS